MTPGTVLLVAALAALLVSVALGVAAALLARAPASADGAPVVSARRPILAAADAALLLATAILVLALALRGVAAGRPPLTNLYEVTLAFASSLLVAYLVAARRAPLRALAPLVALLAAGLLAVALQFPDEVIPLAPALQTPLLLSVHVGAAIAAYALSGLAFAAAVGELAQRSAGDRIAALPAAETCRRVAYRSVLVAFPILTAAIALGSLWANLAWRSYWSNDPKELAAAGTWMLYAAYLHVAGRGDRLGRAAPWLLVAGFGAVLFTFLGASLVFPGQHSYAGV